MPLKCNEMLEQFLGGKEWMGRQGVDGFYYYYYSHDLLYLRAVKFQLFCSFVNTKYIEKIDNLENS